MDNNSRLASKVTLPAKGEWNKAFHSELVELSKTYNQRVVDTDIVERFPKISEDEPVLIFFGKFLYTKGLVLTILLFLP